ncbi:MAG TPA: preprotein translocase subunit SecE [Hyphomonadaceae bacterium]|nr:preprotein translocase subunit SecE [Hyphomonadaceae bacterium]
MSETKPKANPLQFLRSVRAEMRQVTWATRNETLTASIMVLIMAGLAAVFLGIVDFVIRMVITFALGLS